MLSLGAISELTISGLATAQQPNTNLTPGTGHLVLTGRIPTLAQTANATLTPGTGHLVLTGYAPILARGTILTPGTGHLVLTGRVPTLTQTGPVVITGVTGHLLLTGYQPALTQTAPPPPPAPSAGAGGGSFVPDEGEQRLGYKRRRAALRKAIAEAIDGPEKEQALEVLAPYLPAPKPENRQRLAGADYILSRLNWAQMAESMGRVQERLQAIAEEREEEEAFLLMD